MKYYIIAGEASGDLHGSNLMKALYKEDPNAEIRFWGGDLMQKTGGTLAKHYRELAFMGFIEVIFNLKTILNNIKFCKKDILEFQPDALIFIDYPGFNMRIAKWAKSLRIKTHYYISPQIWAWKESRIKSIRRDVDKMYVILPFEKEFGNHMSMIPFNDKFGKDEYEDRTIDAAIESLTISDSNEVFSFNFFGNVHSNFLNLAKWKSVDIKIVALKNGMNWVPSMS